MKGYKFVLSIIVIIGLYVSFVFFVGKREKTDTKPVITAPNEVLQISVYDQESVLLAGVEATDDEDGDLTDQVFIENISTFDAEQCRTVTYAVFDSSDNLSRTTRQIQYTDYQAPEFSVNQGLYYYLLYSLDALKDYVSASSIVDGDISSQISVDRYSNENGNYDVTYSVIDSCGTRTTLTLKIDELKKEPNLEILLSDYLIRVDRGSEINPYDYIEAVQLQGLVYDYYYNDLEVINDYQAAVPGMYEFIYRIATANGDFGYNKLVVIVKE